MQDFVVDGEPRQQSIGFDATDRQNIIVTVGVLVNRTQEAILLDDLYETTYDDGFRPFRTKSRDLSLPPEKIYQIMNRCNGEIGICVHRGDVKLTYAEAVHSAILLDDLSVTPANTIAIVDGDRARADKLFQGTSSLDLRPPPVTNCVQSELYYPHLLFADLIAGIIADNIADDSSALTSVVPEGPVKVINDTTQRSRRGRWGRIYSAVARGEGEVQQAIYEQRYANSVRERVSCWFHGIFGKTHAPAPDTDGIQPVAGRLNAIGCEDVATWISQQ